MKIKKRQFARLKDIAEGLGGTLRPQLDKLISDIESVQKVKTIKEGGLRDAVEAISEPKIGDVGYFWDFIEDGVGHVVYGVLLGINIFNTEPYKAGNLFYENFSKTPPELR